MSRRVLVVAVLVALVATIAFIGVSLAPATSTTPRADSVDDAAIVDDTDDSAGPAPARTSPRVLLGEVVDDDGAGISGAVVAVIVGESSARQVVSDPDGHFALDDLPATINRLEFRAAGFTDASVDGTALPPSGEAFWSQVLVAEPGSRAILVRVNADTPIEGATLYRVTTNPKKPLVAVGTSNAAGRVIVGGSPDDTFLAAHLGHGAADAINDVATLPAGAEVRIVVEDEAHGPVAGARVVLRPVIEQSAAYAAYAMRLLDRGTDAVVTAADGRITWPVAAGSFTVDVTASGYRPVVRVAGRSRAGETTDIVIELQASPSVSGVVVDAVTGAPVTDALVRGDSGGRVGQVAHTDLDGRFTLNAFEDRPSSLTVIKKGYRSLTIGGVDGSASRIDDLELHLVPGKGDVVVGIGISIGGGEQDEPGLRVQFIERGSPAEAAGIVVGDRVVAVDGSALTDDLAAAVGSIRGAPDTSVELTLQDDNGRRRTLTIQRTTITVRKRGRWR